MGPPLTVVAVVPAVLTVAAVLQAQGRQAMCPMLRLLCLLRLRGFAPA